MRNLVIGIVIGIGIGIAVIELDARQRDAWTYGVGTWTCGKWRDLRTSRAAGARSNAVEIEYLAAEQWVLGFVTGIAWDRNEAMETDRIDIQQLWAALDSTCFRDPRGPLRRAAEDVFFQVSTRRGSSGPIRIR